MDEELILKERTALAFMYPNPVVFYTERQGLDDPRKCPECGQEFPPTFWALVEGEDSTKTRFMPVSRPLYINGYGGHCHHCGKEIHRESMLVHFIQFRMVLGKWCHVFRAVDAKCEACGKPFDYMDIFCTSPFDPVDFLGKEKDDDTEA